MACYSVPVTAAVLLFIARKARKDRQALKLLNLMLAAGSVMLVIDHWFNGELLLVPENLEADLFLGFLMSLGTVLLWALLIHTNKNLLFSPAEAKN
jgi:hypothetical protein